MKLFEFMAKDFFKDYGITVPKGIVAENPEEVKKATYRLGEVAIKAQVLTGGRGKAGGIGFSSNPQHAFELAKKLFNTEIKGHKIEKVLVEQKVIFDQELYLAIIVDGSLRKPLLIVSASGGVDIEDVPEDKIIKMPIDKRYGIQPFMLREVGRRLQLEGVLIKQLTDTVTKLYRIFNDYDAELVEINPLVRSENALIAADGKMVIDDEAFFRYKANVPLTDERTEREKQAGDLGISYVELDGDIAVMANGAGITMATLDIIQHYGGSARNFMDAGGGAGEEATAKALEILLDTNPKAILINIFGGITRCDDVARAFTTVKNNLNIQVPVVVRLVGTNEDQGQRILAEAGVKAYKDLNEAAKKVVEIVYAS